ncbi:Ubiquitin-specific protease family C19-related protein [Corchorus olitorius]|uniref:Ubiquitin-specific protease family C19-related protein n=1 Tax=Corchorus olitorius TaxID=93759 RepID=A0A1R3ISH5_9ROSI|nr:Ubiquitin-specific protease family C19-related protein [Corchorus olitorius]
MWWLLGITEGLYREKTIAVVRLLSTLPEIVNIRGFRILKDDLIVVTKILSSYPKIKSRLLFHETISQDCVLNILAEVYKMATMEREKYNLDEIERMEDGIEELEFAGLDIAWLKDLVVQARNKVEDYGDKDR